jgi:hypothetical protein
VIKPAPAAAGAATLGRMAACSPPIRRFRLLGLAIALSLAGEQAACSLPFAPSPSTHATPSPSQDLPLSVLEQRPLQLKPLSKGGSCPVTEVSKPSGAKGWPYGDGRGSGPVYAVGVFPIPPAQTWKILWTSSPSYRGSILIRGRQLDGANQVYLNVDRGESAPLEPKLQVTESSGRVTSLFTMAYLSTDRANAAQFRDWPSAEYVASPGCYAWQVDGSSFSETIVFRAARQS